MEKEEILQKNREDNKSSDEMERIMLEHAGKVGMAVGGGMCALLMFLEILFLRTINLTAWTVYFSMLGAEFLVRFIKLKHRSELAIAILYLAIALIFFGRIMIRLIG